LFQIQESQNVKNVNCWLFLPLLRNSRNFKFWKDPTPKIIGKSLPKSKLILLVMESIDGSFETFFPEYDDMIEELLWCTDNNLWYADVIWYQF